MRRILPFLLPIATLLGCAHPQIIKGSVVTRNGEPLDRVIVSLSPGNVEIITDEDGTFFIDYLRDEQGDRAKLTKKTDYQITAFRAGYHSSSSNIYFKRGELLLEPMTLTEDKIRVQPGNENIDPNLFPDRSQNSGAAYEGE